MFRKLFWLYSNILILIQGAKYGFDTDKPCIFLKINKVVDWAPLGIQADDVDTFFATVSFVVALKYFSFGAYYYAYLDRVKLDVVWELL